MTQFTKRASILLGLVLLTLFGSITVHYVNSANVPEEITHILGYLKFDMPNWAESIVANYFFWVAFVLTIVTFVVVIGILFYPRNYTQIKLEDSKSGVLLLKRSAIEGYVRAIVTENEALKDPQISVKMYKKKFNVKVSGKIIPRVDIVEKVDNLKQDIQSGLHQFFGLTKNVKFTVKVKNIEESEKVISNRVE